MSSLLVFREDIDRTVAWRLAVTALLVTSGGLLAALAPLALKGMVDEASSIHGPTESAVWGRALTFGAAYLLALCVGRLLTELRSALIGSAEQLLYARLRRRYFGHILSLTLSFHRDRQAGALGQILQQAITGYQIVIFNLVNGVVPVLVELLTVTVVLASLSQPALTATFAITAGAYIAVLRYKGRDIANSARSISETSIGAQGMLADGLLNVETIKCFGAEDRARTRFEKATIALENGWAALRRARLCVGLSVTVTFALAMAAVLSIALHGVLNGTLSIGGFVLANAYLFQLVRPLEMLGSAARDMSQAVEFIRPLRDVLAEHSEQCPPRDQPAVPSSSDPVQEATPRKRHDTVEGAAPVPSGICFRQVHLRYHDGPAVLNGLNLDVAEGRTVAIVGASGCGKSSLLRLLLRLYQPTAGKISLDGVDIESLSIDKLRSQIALVPQDTVLFNESIAFNIGIARAEVTRHEVERAAGVAQLHEFIRSLPAGYDTVVGERGLNLSGGERQRIAIARAVLKEPRIYLLDEATSMLDSVTERAVFRNLRRVSARSTTITVAHRLSTIRDANEILVMDRGKIIERGDHATLIAMSGAYAAMWRAQQYTASHEGAIV